MTLLVVVGATLVVVVLAILIVMIIGVLALMAVAIVIMAALLRVRRHGGGELRCDVRAVGGCQQECLWGRSRPGLKREGSERGYLKQCASGATGVRLIVLAQPRYYEGQGGRGFSDSERRASRC